MAEEALKRYNGKDKPMYNRPFKINWGSNKKSQGQANPQDPTQADVVPVSRHSTLTNFMTPNALNLLSKDNNNLNEEQQLKAATLKALGLSGAVEYQHTPSNNTEAPVLAPEPSNFEINPTTYNCENPTSIYVGDLDQKCDNLYLEEIFKTRYKTVVGVKIIKDPTTRNSKGFGFIMFASPEEAERAIKEMNGFQVLTRKIRTGKSTSKSNTASSGGTQTGMGQNNMQPQMGSYMGGMPSMQQPMFQQGVQEKMYMQSLQGMNHMSQYMNSLYGMMNQPPRDPSQPNPYTQMYPPNPDNNTQTMNMAQNYYQMNPMAAMNYGYLYDPNMLKLMNMANPLTLSQVQPNPTKVEPQNENKIEEEEVELNQEEMERLEREKAEQNKFQIEELLGKRASMLKKKIDSEKNNENGTMNMHDASEESDIERVKFRNRVDLFSKLNQDKSPEEELKERMTSSLDSVSSSQNFCNKFIIQMFDS